MLGNMTSLGGPHLLADIVVAAAQQQGPQQDDRTGAQHSLWPGSRGHATRQQEETLKLRTGPGKAHHKWVERIASSSDSKSADRWPLHNGGWVTLKVVWKLNSKPSEYYLNPLGGVADSLKLALSDMEEGRPSAKHCPPSCKAPATKAAANNNAAASVASPSSQGAGAGPTPAPGSANNAAAQRQDVPAGPGGAAPGQALPARSYYPALSDSDDEEPLLASARRHEAAAVEDVAVGGGSVGAQGMEEPLRGPLLLAGGASSQRSQEHVAPSGTEQAPRNGKLTIKIKKTGAPKGDANNTSPTTSDTEGAPPEPPAVPQGAGLGADQEEGRRLPPQLASLGPSCHSSVSGTHRALSTSSPTAVAAVGGPGPAVGGGGSGAEGVAMSPPPAGLGGDWPCEDLADLFGPAPAAAPAGAEQEVAGMGVSTPPATTIAAASDAAAAAGGGGPAANQQQGGTTPLPLAAAADAGNGEEDMEVDMEVTPGSGSAELAQRGGLVMLEQAAHGYPGALPSTGASTPAHSGQPNAPIAAAAAVAGQHLSGDNLVAPGMVLPSANGGSSGTGGSMFEAPAGMVPPPPPPPAFAASTEVSTPAALPPGNTAGAASEEHPPPLPPQDVAACQQYAAECQQHAAGWQQYATGLEQAAADAEARSAAAYKMGVAAGKGKLAEAEHKLRRLEEAAAGHEAALREAEAKCASDRQAAADAAASIRPALIRAAVAQQWLKASQDELKQQVAAAAKEREDQEAAGNALRAAVEEERQLRQAAEDKAREAEATAAGLQQKLDAVKALLEEARPHKRARTNSPE